MTAPTPGCGSTTDAKKRKRETERTAPALSGLEALLAGHYQSGTLTGSPVVGGDGQRRWMCACGERGLGVTRAHLKRPNAVAGHRAHLAAAIRDYLTLEHAEALAAVARVEALADEWDERAKTLTPCTGSDCAGCRLGVAASQLRAELAATDTTALDAERDRAHAQACETVARAIEDSVRYGFGMRPDGSEDPLASAYVEGLRDAADTARDQATRRAEQLARFP